MLNEERDRVNTSTITASWTMANGIVDYYQVSCSNGTASPAQVNPSEDLEASCTRLSTPGDNYTISVTTVSNGQNSAVSTITITALPSQVTNLAESGATNDSVSATWTKPDGVVSSYNVTCPDGTTRTEPEENDDSTHSVTCSGLPDPGPGGNHIIMVVTLSGSKASDPATVTITAFPNSVVLREDGVTTRQITVQWVDPVGEEDSFIVDCGDDGSNDITLFPGDATDNTFEATCNTSAAGAPYDITVTSVSGDKESPVTGTFTAATPDGVTFEEGSASTTAVTVTWIALARADGFRVNCSEGTPSHEGTPSPDSPLPGSATEVTCNGVTPGGNHSVSVITLENNGESPAAVMYVVAVPLSADLAADTSTINSVSAMWPYPGGLVDIFEVNCSNGTERNATLAANEDLNSSYVVSCDGVWNPGDNYSMVVTSLSNGEENSASIILTALPESVSLNEAIDMVTTTTITASWTKPNGIVDYYEVSCSNGDPSPVMGNPSGNLTASCTGLSTPGDDYTISVTSVSNGQRSETDTITITALPEAVELSEGESNTTVISATWTVPNSVVDTFNITCSDGTASPPSISVDSSQAGQQLTAYCVGLPTSGEQYDLSVVAISKEKLSAVSTVGVFALPLGVDLEEGPSTLTSVSASWMRQNDTVESYSITCSHGDAFPSTIEDTNQESFSAACVNLTGPGATYSMNVFSEVGTDSSSNGTRASSLINLVAVPASVESIAVTEPTTTTVDVQWNLTQCSECVYNYFLLTFQPDSQEAIRVDYMAGVNEYSSQVSGLIQGRSYNFTVVSVSGVGVEDATLKTSEEKSVDQRTVPATPFGLVIVSSQRELNLEWEYQGDADDFTITITPDHGRAVFNENFTRPAAEITDLTPGTIYDIAIVTVSGNERSEPITDTARTEPDKPSPVGNPQAEVVDKNTITLTYESPDEPNGNITSNVISYIGTRDDNPSHEFSKVYSPPVLTVTYDDLYPGFSYTFTIIAVNDGPFESEPVSTAPVETPQEEPSPVPEDYPYEANTVFSETSTTSFAVVLPDDLFSHDNGELLSFAIIITKEANDQTVGSTELTYDEARAQNGNMPAYITAIDIPYPYPPSFGSNRKRRATEPSATVVIGNGTCAGSPKEYCNRGLDDDTEYYYAFRAYNGMGNVTSSTFGPVKTVKDNTAGIAAGVSVSLIIIIVAVVVVVVFLKRRQPKEPSPRPSLEGRENQGYDGPDHEMRPTRRKTGGSMHRKSHSKPIVLNKFEGHYGRMKADSDFRFTEEYDEIRLVGKDQAIVSALEMVNRAKNRFTNILPYEHSRVKLAALADDSDTDYINANYIPGYNSPREFMACQGPLPGTVDDMWRMIWEKKTSIIVMLTQLVEKGKIKCHEYWPADYNPVTYGSIQVSVQALQQYDHWVIREFSISQGDEIRKLTQYHFMSWPDHGVPDKTWTMLDFVRTVREAIQKTASDRPIVAHCSAGVGRTGTYIALDRLMQAMQENDYIDIFGIICEMRMQRNHMVQTEKQYIFIHECVMDLLRRGEEEDTGESIYVNLPSNGFKDPDDVNKNLLDQAV
ncbi:receptor-type tyrosine-protein phosphatase beta isoform X2 [Strongylocentrotus purpuratus]|uniref:protein-tyrosine-phosphatase n=1 Tax=Strongylocentrotus purpuratus TaxID=7668 RepID=A0A7M7NZV3_STRPU|nr:receptor-type tyrosine-protein phosphatase beta isoform X2 [Strongylocentrotus purpuratus]